MENWLPVDGWNGKYFISDLGRFKSLKGKFKLKHPSGYITPGTVDSLGYCVVTLRRPDQKERFRVHTIVGNHFIEKPRDGKAYCINHKNGIKTDNRAVNLEWLTKGDNIRHAVETGLMNIKGERHPLSKLTSQKVLEIRRLRSEGMGCKEIAGQFGISRRHVGDVANGVNWGWLH